MKKLLSIAMSAFAVSAFAAGSTEIGLTEISTTNQNTIVAVPFASLTNGVADIAAKDLVKVANLPAATRMFIFNGSQYSAFIADDGAWSPLDNVTDDAGVVGVTVSKGDANATLVKGSAIWIVLPEVPTVPQNIYIYGAYQTGVTSAIAAGMNLVANPLQGEAVFTFTATKGDQITVPNDNAAPTVYTYNGSTWKTVVNNEKIEGKPSVPAGRGFWYNYKGQEPGTMSWSLKPKPSN